MSHNEGVRKRVLVVLTLCSATACGLSVVGTAAFDSSDSTDGQAPSVDAGTASDANGILTVDAETPPVDSGPVLPPIDAAGACTAGACLAAPAGWLLIAYGNGTVSCPSGFSSTDVVESPVVTATACQCSAASCKILTTPNCSSGSIGSSYDNGTAKCDQTGAALDLDDGGCVQYTNSFGDHAELAAPSAVGSGTCSAPAAANKAGVTTSAGRVCISTCAAVCDPTIAANFKACLLQAGDQTCPTNAPTKHLTGTDVSVSCGDCGCSVSHTGCAGSVEFYGNSNCTNPVLKMDSGACIDPGGASFRSYQWSGEATGLACSVSNPPTGTVNLTGLSTICCP